MDRVIAHLGLTQALETLLRICDPLAPGNVVIEACVAIDQNIDPGTHLVGDQHSNEISILLAEATAGHSDRERPSAERLRIRARPGQTTGCRRNKRPVFRHTEHHVSLRGDKKSTASGSAAWRTGPG